MSNHFDATGIQLIEQESFEETIPADHIKIFHDATTGMPYYRTASGLNIPIGSSHVSLYDTTPNATSNTTFDLDTNTAEAQLCTHLWGRAMLRGSVAATTDVSYLLFNGDTTAANYRHAGNATTEAATNSPFGGNTPRFGTLTAGSSPAGEFAMFEFLILNFRSTSFVKKLAYRLSMYFTSGASFLYIEGGIHWNNTNAITSIQIRTDNHPTDVFHTTSRVNLVGIKL